MSFVWSLNSVSYFCSFIHPFSKHYIDLIKDAKVLQELPSTVPTLSHARKHILLVTLLLLHCAPFSYSNKQRLFLPVDFCTCFFLRWFYFSFCSFWVADSLIPRNLSERPSLTIFSYSSFHFVLYYRFLFVFFIAFVPLWIVKNDFLFSCFSHYRKIPYGQGAFCLI